MERMVGNTRVGRVGGGRIGTVHAAKCYDQSRLITWNFKSHVTFFAWI